jgi:hypothetical protein
MIHSRFVKSVAIRAGDQLLPAEPVKYYHDQFAVLLRVKKDIPHQMLTPLRFSTGTQPPHLLITQSLHNGEWEIDIRSASSKLTVAESRTYLSQPAYGLLVDKHGTPAGLCMNGDLPIDESWKGSPKDWAGLDAAEYQALMDATLEKARQTILRVTLHFRSPKQAPGSDSYGEGTTEKQAIGVMVDAKTVLIFATIQPKITARLERILVNPPDGEPIAATFAGTLKDYGCLLGALETPAKASARFSTRDPREFINRLLPAVVVRLEGENVTYYAEHRHMVGVDLGWKRQMRLDILSPPGNTLLFDPEGDLLAMPVSRRTKISLGDGSSADPQLTASMYLQEVIADYASHIDPNNAPLSEDEEDRLAWLGVELQALDDDLARENRVSHLTQDGRIGALVSYVYPDSPAAKAGIEMGYILLRLHVEDEPKPIDVRVENPDGSYYPQLWGKFDQIPERIFSRVPRPWLPAENYLTRKLTDLGFGKKFALEFFHDGQTLRKDFAVTQSPPHYDTAAKGKSQTLGMTVRNLTYEVRRYFRMEETEPGVIISTKIEPGSKASMAGLKPFEIITHINDQPVTCVKDFEKLAAAGGELRLSVKRWTQNRVVKIMTDDDSRPEATERVEMSEEPENTPAE